MQRLIDADLLAEHKCVGSIFEEVSPQMAYQVGWNDAIDAIIENAPTVDAEPVRHGRWIVEEWINTIFCSECGNSWHIMDNDTETFVYCPNCGAKMQE